jgi:two-component system, chemotaxis family, CheB/CheR fusion protein
MERYCNLLLDAIPHQLFLKDRSSVYLACNHHFARMLGLTPDQVVGRTDLDLFPGNLAVKYRSDDQRIMESGMAEVIEEQFVHEDYSGWVRTVKTPIRDEAGDVIGIHGIFWDITAEKAAETGRKEQEELFHNTFEQAAVGIAHVALDGTWLRVNRRLCELVGYGHDELMAHTFQEITHPHDLARDLTFVQQLLAGDLPSYSMEKRYLRKSGDVIWCNLTVSLVRTAAGEPHYFIAVIEDIGDRKYAEEELLLYREKLETLVAARTAELSRSEFSLREAQRLAQLGSWELDLTTNRLVWSEEIYRIFELDPDSFAASYEAFLERVHPEDRDTVNSAYTASLVSKTPYDLVHRLLLDDGRIKYVHERCETDYDAADQAIRSRGTVQDITERCEMEERLRQLSLVDELTNLANRRAFFMLAKQMIKIAARTKGRLCMLYIDVNDFKQVNDSYGHREGDLALMDTARILLSSCRAADIVGRIGGDEFAILATDVSGDTPDRILSRMAENIQAHAIEGERPFRLSLSCGVAMYEPGSPMTLEELLDAADKRMYEEKMRHRAKSSKEIHS